MKKTEWGPRSQVQKVLLEAEEIVKCCRRLTESRNEDGSLDLAIWMVTDDLERINFVAVVQDRERVQQKREIRDSLYR